MASEDSKALLTNQEAASLLGILEPEVGQAIEAGTLRKVYHRENPEASLEHYVLAADVHNMIREREEAQLTREDLRTMSPTAILEAKTAGRLETILGREPSSAPRAELGDSVQLTREDLKTMKPDEILKAKEAGQLRDLVNGGQS